MVRLLLNNIREKYNLWLKSALVYKASSSASVTISKRNTTIEGRIIVGENSTLQIEEGVKFSGQLLIGDNCNVYIGKNCGFINVEFNIRNGAELKIGESCIFDASERHSNVINVEDGAKMYLKEHVRIQADILVRFGGEFTIGMYSSVNWGSEIRCEEKITIGEYCLMSYEVCIFDTNTHSSDWKERRGNIPNRAHEIKRPSTKPVIIGNDVWIGKGATILKGTVIGGKSIIGIRTIVPSGNYSESSIIVSAKPVVLNK